MKLRYSFSLAGTTAILLNEVVNSFVVSSTLIHQPQQTRTTHLKPSNKRRSFLSVSSNNDKDDDSFDDRSKAKLSEIPFFAVSEPPPFFADRTTTFSDITKTKKKVKRSKKGMAFSSEAPAWMVEEFLSFKGDSLLAKEGGRVTSIDDKEDDKPKEVEIKEDIKNEKGEKNEEISLIAKDETNNEIKLGGGENVEVKETGVTKPKVKVDITKPKVNVDDTKSKVKVDDTKSKTKVANKVEKKNNVVTMKEKVGKIFGNTPVRINPFRSLENMKGSFQLEKFKRSFEMKKIKTNFETEKMVKQGLEGMASAVNIATGTTASTVKVLHDIWMEVDDTIKSQIDKRNTKTQKIENEKKQRTLLGARLQIDSKQRAYRRKVFEYTKQKMLLEARIQVDRDEREYHILVAKLLKETNQEALLQARLLLDTEQREKSSRLLRDETQKALFETKIQIEINERKKLEDAKQKAILEAQKLEFAKLKETNQEALLQARLLLDTEQREKRSRLLRDETQKALLETKIQIEINEREKLEDAKQKAILEARKLEFAKQMALFEARLQMDRKTLLKKEAIVSDNKANNAATSTREENEKDFINSYSAYLDQKSAIHNEPSAPTDSHLHTLSKSATYAPTSMMDSYANSFPSSSTPASLSYLDFLPRVTFPPSKRTPSKTSQMDRQLNQDYMNSVVHEGGWDTINEGKKKEEQRAINSMKSSFEKFSSPLTSTPKSLVYLDSIPRVPYQSSKKVVKRSSYSPLTHTERVSDEVDTTASVYGAWDDLKEVRKKERERTENSTKNLRKDINERSDSQHTVPSYLEQISSGTNGTESPLSTSTTTKSSTITNSYLDSLPSVSTSAHKGRWDCIEEGKKKEEHRVVRSMMKSHKRFSSPRSSTPTSLSYLDSLPRIAFPTILSKKTAKRSAYSKLTHTEGALDQDNINPSVYEGAWDSIEEGTKMEEERVVRSMTKSYKSSIPRTSTPASLSYLDSLPRITSPISSSVKRSSYTTKTHTEDAPRKDSSTVYEGAWDSVEEGKKTEEERAVRLMTKSYKSSIPRTSTPASLSYLDSLPRIAFPTILSEKRTKKGAYSKLTHTEGALDQDNITSSVSEGAWDSVEGGTKMEEERAVRSMTKSYKSSIPRTSTPTSLSYLDSLPRITSPISSSVKRSSYATKTHTEDAPEKDNSTLYEGAWDSVDEGKIKEKERTAHLNSLLIEAQTHQDEMKKRRQQGIDDALVFEAQVHQNEMKKRRQLYMAEKQKVQEALRGNRSEIVSGQREPHPENQEMDDNLNVQTGYRIKDASTSSDFLEQEEENPVWLIDEFESITEDSFDAKNGRIGVSDTEEVKPKKEKEFLNSEPSMDTPLQSTPSSLSYLDSLLRVEYPATKPIKNTPLKEIEQLINQDPIKSVVYDGAWDSVEEGKKKEQERVVILNTRLGQDRKTKTEKETERAKRLAAQVQQALQKIAEVKATKISSKKKIIADNSTVHESNLHEIPKEDAASDLLP